MKMTGMRGVIHRAFAFTEPKIKTGISVEKTGYRDSHTGKDLNGLLILPESGFADLEGAQSQNRGYPVPYFLGQGLVQFAFQL